MNRILDIALLILSIAIAAHLLITHTAPWELIAAYWMVNAVKNGGKLR